jgi:hypothetical protein
MIFVTTPELMTEFPASGCDHDYTELSVFPHTPCQTPLTLCHHVAWYRAEEKKVVESHLLANRNAMLEREVQMLRRAAEDRQLEERNVMLEEEVQELRKRELMLQAHMRTIEWVLDPVMGLKDADILE